MTPEEQKCVEQLQLHIDWIREGFELEFRDKDAWVRSQGPSWGVHEYRRKPSPKYVPWTAEDAGEFRGIWVRYQGENKTENMITAFDPSDNTVYLGEWVSLASIHSAFEKLDGTPCGKVVSE